MKGSEKSNAGTHRIDVEEPAPGVRVVAFEEPPANGGEPSDKYRTFTLWIVPNSVYRRGINVQVVTPSNAPVASTTLP